MKPPARMIFLTLALFTLIFSVASSPGIEERGSAYMLELAAKILPDPVEAVENLNAASVQPERAHGMVLIKGGCFQMGNVLGDGDSDEKPVREVCVDDYYLSDHEVTQGEWEEMMGSNPSLFSGCGKDCPVERVSWDDVQKFIRKLNGKKDEKYRLPTEAEWEFAARSGGKEEKWSGTADKSSLRDYAWYETNSGSKTHSVKTKRPNGLGLYDMSGNVWEWVSDMYGAYNSGSVKNPSGPSSGSRRVRRGGCWNNDSRYLRASHRGYLAPEASRYYLGFRLARTY